MPKLVGDISGTAELMLCTIADDMVRNNKLLEGTYFRAVGRILTPLEYIGEYTEIVRNLSISHETYFEMNYKFVENELRKLGIPTIDCNINLTEANMITLIGRKPIFKFRTWVANGYIPIVVHEWGGLVENQHA